MKKQKTIEDYTILVPKKLKCKYRNGYVRNMLGYLIFRWNGYAEQRENNDGWFYATNSELLETLGGSKTTLQKYQCKLVLDGTIEFRSGSFSGRKANEYRLPFLEKKCTEKCTEDIVDSQEVNTKKCTDKKHTERNMVEIEKKCTEKDDVSGHILRDPKISEKCTEDIVENQTVEVKKCTEETPYFHTEKCTTDIEPDIETENKKLSILKSDDTMEEKNVKKQEPENGDGFQWNWDKYISLSSWKDRVDYCVGVQSLVPDQDREQARKWVWGKWMNYLNSVENGDLTWDDVYHYFSAFLNWVKVTSNELEWYREKKLQMKSQFRVAALHRLFNEHADMVENAKSGYMENPSFFSSEYGKNMKNLKRVYSIAGESRDGEMVAAETKMRMTWEEVTTTQRKKVSVPDPDEEYRRNGEGVLVLTSITGMKVPEKKKETDLRSDYGDLPFCD